MCHFHRSSIVDIQYLSVDKFPLSRSYTCLFLFSSNPMTIVGAVLYIQYPLFPIIFLISRYTYLEEGTKKLGRTGVRRVRLHYFFITAQDADAVISCPIQWRCLLVTYELADDIDDNWHRLQCDPTTQPVHLKVAIILTWNFGIDVRSHQFVIICPVSFPSLSSAKPPVSI